MTTSRIVEAGECLSCGHIQPFVIYQPLKDRASVGICDGCAQLAEPNRGPCSEERGCGCNRHDVDNPECMCGSCRSVAAEWEGSL